MYKFQFNQMWLVQYEEKDNKMLILIIFNLPIFLFTILNSKSIFFYYIIKKIVNSFRNRKHSDLMKHT